MGRPPAAGPRRAGLRPGQARADARDPRHVAVRARGVRQRGAGLGQLRDPGAGGHAGPEGALPAPAAGRRPAVRVLDDRAGHGGLRSHAAADARRARRRRVGDQRPQVVLDQRQRRRLPDRDGGHEPGRAAAPARLDADRAGRHAGREHRPRHPDDGAPGRALRPLRRPRRDLLRGRARAGRRAARRRGRGLPDRPAPARARAHPPLHALARRVAARLRHALRARRLALRVRLDAVREADGPELDRGLAGADAARRG